MRSERYTNHAQPFRMRPTGRPPGSCADLELVFTVYPEHLSQVQSRLAAEKICMHQIGHVIAQPGVYVVSQTSRRCFTTPGFEHLTGLTDVGLIRQKQGLPMRPVAGSPSKQ